MKLKSLTAITTVATLTQLSSAEATELQLALTALGYPLAADGIVGPLTAAAWARWKADNRLDRPESIGPASVTLLQSRLDAPVVPSQAVQIVKSFEGFRAEAYDDGTGVWTVGYGTTHYPDGAAVESGQAVSEAEAEAYLSSDLRGTATTLSGTIPNWSQMNGNRRSSLISFGYNLGANFFGADGFGQISSALNEHRWDDVPAVMTLYSNPGSSVHDGLLRRRKAEGELWQGAGPFAQGAG